MGASSGAKATEPRANAAAKSFSILLSPVIRRSSPILPTPARSSSSPIPQIGNYGTNSADDEAARPYIEGLIMREFSPISSNWRSHAGRGRISGALQRSRDLARSIPAPWSAICATNGVMRGVISTLETDPDKLVAKARSIRRWTAPTSRASSRRKIVYSSGREGPRSQQIPRRDAGEIARRRSPCRGLRLRHQAEHPAHAERRGLQRDGGSRATTAEDVLALKPDGVFLSNGPGDPEPVTYAQENIRRLRAARRSLASVSDISSSAWRSAAKPTSSSLAITAAIIR